MNIKIEYEDILFCEKIFKYLHSNPEVSGKEYKTSKFLKEIFRKWGYPIIELPGTGFIVEYISNLKGKTIALRAELDALPIQESNRNYYYKKEFISKNKGCSHACGHDAHMAMLTTVLYILHKRQIVLPGNILFLFEEGEEEGLGIGHMMDKLTNYNIEAVWGLHVTPNIPSGKVCIQPGVIMAGDVDILFTIEGEGGHASRPDVCKNPIDVAIEAITVINRLWVNEFPPELPITFAITTIQAGEKCNIIPEQVKIGGSFRFLDEELAKRILNRIKECITSIVKLHGCKVKYDPCMEVFGSATVNDGKLAMTVQEGFKEMGLVESIMQINPLYSSESFAHYGEKYPSLYSLLGVMNNDLGTLAPLHSPNFDLDISCFSLGILATFTFIYKCLYDLN